MSGAFAVQYVDGPGGLIAVADAVTLLQQDLLTSPNPPIVDESLDGSALLTLYPPPPGLVITRVLWSSNWGSSGADQALVLISLQEDGRPYFSGLVIARGGFPGMAESQPVDETPAPTLQPISEAAPATRGREVYASDLSAGWPAVKQDALTGEPLPTGGYQMTATPAGWIYTSRLAISTFYAEVSARPQDCPPDAGYGLLFHYIDPGRFRFFIVWCSGAYSLVERPEAARTVVLAEGMMPATLDPSTGEHRLGVRATDSGLDLFVDDIPIARTAASSMPAGDIGMYVEAAGRKPITVVFTGLRVYEAGP